MFSNEFEKVAKKGVPIGGGFAMFPSFSKNTDQALRHHNKGVLMKMQGHKPVAKTTPVKSTNPRRVKLQDLSQEKIRRIIGADSAV